MKILTSKPIIVKVALSIFLILCLTQTANAHVVVVDLEDMSTTDTVFLYLKLGFEHIIPLGIDHILFVLSLFLLNPKLRPILTQATAFTVAHTVTLGLSMYQVINPPSAIVEPIIAISIVYVAMENILSPKLKPSRIGIVFLFGLIHGMGFASVLGNLGLPKDSFLTSLVLFNLGVELGQISIIILAYFLLGKFFGNKPYYRKYIVIPMSALIAIIATYWTIQRIFFT